MSNIITIQQIPLRQQKELLCSKPISGIIILRNQINFERSFLSPPTSQEEQFNNRN